MRMEAVLGLALAAVAVLFLIVHLDGVRTTLLAAVPSAHNDLANWLVIVIALVAVPVVLVGVAVMGFKVMTGE